MDGQFVAALLGFVVTSTFSPGPNNIMASNAGAQFGFVASLPLVGSIWLGTLGVLLAVNLGAAAALAGNPEMKRIIAVLGSAYLIYLAWTVLRRPAAIAGNAPQPRRLAAAVAFQVINLKAWMTMLVLTTTFVPAGASPFLSLTVATIFASVNLIAITSWAAFGATFRRVLERPEIERVYRRVVASAFLLTVVTLYV